MSRTGPCIPATTTGMPTWWSTRAAARVFGSIARANCRAMDRPAWHGARRRHRCRLGERKLSAVTPQERTTPAGRFVASLAPDLKGQEILWIDYDSALALHRVAKGTPAERRAERLQSASPDDNRISYGCINVAVAFYEGVVSPAFSHSNGVVYILPETRAAREVFGSYDGMRRCNKTVASPSPTRHRVGHAVAITRDRQHGGVSAAPTTTVSQSDHVQGRARPREVMHNSTKYLSACILCRHRRLRVAAGGSGRAVRQRRPRWLAGDHHIHMNSAPTRRGHRARRGATPVSVPTAAIPSHQCTQGARTRPGLMGRPTTVARSAKIITTTLAGAAAGASRGAEVCSFGMESNTRGDHKQPDHAAHPR